MKNAKIIRWHIKIITAKLEVIVQLKLIVTLNCLI